MTYLVVIARGETSFAAYGPDAPGCAAVGETEEGALRLVREAIALHLEALREQGLLVPERRSHAELVGVGAQ